MTEIWMVAVVGVLFLGVLVFVHELGHFLVAKWLGVRVVSFSIGMGPRVFGFQSGGTDYRISALPLGGYVRMAGDTPEAQDRTGAPEEFLSKPWWVRALISAAGPGANLVFALLLYVALYMIGFTLLDLPTRVANVQKGSVAERIGIEPGDIIVTLAGYPVESITTLSEAAQGALSRAGERTWPLEIRREGALLALSVSRQDLRALADGLDWDSGTEIGRVLIGLPAYDVGLREGDQVLAVNGERVVTFSDVSRRLRARPGAEATLHVRRDGRTLDVVVRTSPEGLIGISPVKQLTSRESFPIGRAVVLGTTQTGAVIGQIYSGLWSLVSNPARLHGSVAGPIAIAQVARQQALGGFDQLVSFGAFISLALMVMNLLPIPILDGGHIFFALVEAMRRRPLSLKTQLNFQKVGLFVLVGLVFFALYNDLSRVTQRQRAESDLTRQLEEAAPGDTTAPAGRR